MEEEYEIETTEDIEKIVEKSKIFEKIGMGRVESKIFSMLFCMNKPLTGRYIEKTMDLRQPEISLGTKNLQARGWIREVINQSSGRGRPEKSYELAMKRENVVEEIELSIYEEFETKRETLRELMKKKEI